MRLGADHIKIMMSGGVASPYDPLDSMQFSVDEVKAAVEEAVGLGGYDKRTECVAGLLDQCTRGLMWRSKSTIGFRRQKDVFVSWERAGLERIFEQFKKWGYKVEHSDLERYDLIYIYKNRKKR